MPHWLEQVAAVGRGLLVLSLVVLLVCTAVAVVMIATGAHVPFYEP